MRHTVFNIYTLLYTLSDTFAVNSCLHIKINLVIEVKIKIITTADKKSDSCRELKMFNEVFRSNVLLNNL